VGDEGVFAFRDGLTKDLGIDKNNIEVIVNYVGGGFGSKLMAGIEGKLAAQARVENDDHHRDVHQVEKCGGTRDQRGDRLRQDEVWPTRDDGDDEDGDTGRPVPGGAQRTGERQLVVARHAEEVAYRGREGDVGAQEEHRERGEEAGEQEAVDHPVFDDVVARIYGSADFAEGVQAYLEKRKPRWRGQ